VIVWAAKMKLGFCVHHKMYLLSASVIYFKIYFLMGSFIDNRADKDLCRKSSGKQVHWGFNAVSLWWSQSWQKNYRGLPHMDLVTQALAYNSRQLSGTSLSMLHGNSSVILYICLMI